MTAPTQWVESEEPAPTGAANDYLIAGDSGSERVAPPRENVEYDSDLFSVPLKFV